VTGGAGFIGSHVVDTLVDHGWEVRVLDLPGRTPGGGPADETLNPGAEYVRGDVRDPETVVAALRGIDAVCHQAAKVGLEAGAADVVEYAAHNDVGTAVLLWALDRVGFAGRLVLASSMVVYGDGHYRCHEHGSVRPGPRPPDRLTAGHFDPTCPTCGSAVVAAAIDEDAALDPRNVYAATKLHQEHLCGVLGRRMDIPVTALRYHNVYGPRMPRDTPYAGVAALFRAALEQGEAPRVFEDGRQTRDFVHVRDVARANLLALSAEPAVSGAFNVASGEPRSVGDMAAALADAYGPRAPRPVVTGQWRPGDVRHIIASPAKAAATFGFDASIPFADGMAELAKTQSL
jgi:dTDP-L-rhamnose 4-epimerase